MSFMVESMSVNPTFVAPITPPLVLMRGISKSSGERKILDGISSTWRKTRRWR
jgi:hypothetical protein